MHMIIPQKLKPGDEIRIIAPSRSMSLLGEEQIAHAQKNIEEHGYTVTFSTHCKEKDEFGSSSIESRVSDIHDAFADKKVKAIYTVIGGFNSNQLLPYLNYELIKENPKILCGYSDITALANAITAKTGLITYSGPHFSTWDMKKEREYNIEYIQKCLVDDAPFSITASPTWSDDLWYMDQENREILPNDGMVVLQSGSAEGTIYGGNLCTFNLLQGTEYMPMLQESILFIEDDDLAGDFFPVEFDRNLESLIQQKECLGIKGLIIGRFQKRANMTIEKLQRIMKNKKQLHGIPIIANVDFGHTNPMITFPIGGKAKITAGEKTSIHILQH